MRYVVETRQLARVFDGDPPVDALRDASLTVGVGEKIAIVGRSGSGKSTLLNLLGLLDTPSSGEYLLDGKRVSEMRPKQLNAARAKYIGFVFQAFHVLGHKTAAENVELKLSLLATPRPTRAGIVSSALSQVGLQHRASSPARLLSGGEKQRLALARAIVGSPRLLLADEPTGNLDPESSEVVLSILDDLTQRGIAVVVITHDMEIAAWAGRSYSLIDGVAAVHE